MPGARPDTIGQTGVAATALPSRTHYWLMFAMLAGIAAALLLALGLRVLGEQPGTNTYVMLAQAFLEGRLFVDQCFDVDCVELGGQTFVLMPALPAVITMPFVWLFGSGFSSFLLLAAIFLGTVLWFWNKILAAEDTGRPGRILLLAALAIGTPLFFVVLRSDKIWFFAQISGYLFISAAFYFALVHRSAFLVGVCVGLALLCRQLYVLAAPFLFVLMLRPEDRLFAIDWHKLKTALAMGIPIAAAIAVMFAYNYARFGSPLDSGYALIFSPDFYEGESNFLIRRVQEIGLFSSDYLVFNFVYLFLQGWHATFDPAFQTALTGFDSNGTSILAASPFVLFALLAPLRRDVVIGWLCVAAMITVQLFYHSNGFSQFNVQRYALDWLPILTILMARGLQPANHMIFGLLAAYAGMLNLAMLAVVAVV